MIMEIPPWWWGPLRPVLLFYHLVHVFLVATQFQASVGSVRVSWCHLARRLSPTSHRHVVGGGWRWNGVSGPW